MSARRLFVGTVGALAVALAVYGLVVVEARTGPFEHGVEPASQPASVDATFASGQSGPGGTPCPGDPVDEACSEPFVRVDGTVDGLPILDGAGVYAAFLAGPDREVALGELAFEDGSHVVSAEKATDGEGLERLTVALVANDTSRPSPFVVGSVPLPDGEGSVSEDFEAGLGLGAGTVEVGQVGAFEVSATARGQLSNLTFDPAWSYEAWLLDNDAAPTILGPLEEAATGVGVFDARVPQVVLIELERLEVRLVPNEDVTASLRGFPVASTELSVGSLGG
jgi:hypothetical protein